MADSGEDWDKLIDSYDRTHRGASMSTDDNDEDLPPPPPPPPPAGGATAGGRAPPPPPPGAPPANAASPASSPQPSGSVPPMPGAAGIAAALNARFAAAGGSPPPPPGRGVPPPPPSAASPVSSPGMSPLSTSASPPGPSPMGMGGIAAAIAARNAANAASANGAPSAASFAGARRESNPPPPPPQKPGPPPPPQVQTAASSTSVSSASTPGSVTPGSMTPGSTNGVQRPSLLKALGSAAGGLWNMIQTAGSAVGGVAAEQGPLAPVMQELSSVYSPFPDSSSGKKNLAAIKVVVTAPRIRRMKGHGAGPSAGSVVGSMASSMRSPLSTSADGDDDESLWEEAGNQRADFSNRHWLRFIEPKSGSVLYFNVVTNSAQGERPADYDGSDDEDDDEDMDYLDESEPPGPPPRGAEGMPQPVNFASPRRARQESIILNEAWDEMGKSGAKPPPTPGSLGIDPRLLAAGAKVDGSSGRNSILQASGATATNEEEFVPVAAVVDGGKNATAKANVSLEGFLSSSTLYMKQLEQLLEAGSGAARAAGSGISLSDEMEIKLKMLLVDMQDLQKLMDTDRLSSSGNDVDTLLQLDKLPWDFSSNNLSVQRYRQTTWGIDHKPFEYRMWHMPQYLSTFPLPPDTKAVTIVVKLPEVVGGGDGAAATTRIGVTEKDTCSSAIAMAIKKCSDRLLDKGLTVNDWVLKGMGIADFMYGDTRIMDYECIRMAIRNGEEVKLTLVRKPSPTPDPEICASFIDGYKSKLSENVTVHDPNTVFRDVSSKELKYINMNELTHLPFRFKVLSVDNVNEQSIPRFDTISDLYIKCYLFYGCKNVADPKETQVLELSSDPRWFQWMVYKELTLANIPRGARLGFILYGHKITKPEKELMLGWSVHQLVDDQGFLVGGRMSLRLWSMEARKKGKHGKPREPDVTFLHRATTAQNLSGAQAATLTIQLDEYNLPVVAPVSEKFRDPNIKFIGMELPLKSLTKDQTKQFEGLLACDILKELTAEDQQLLWNLRHHLVKNPAALSKFLQCVNWGNIECRMEAYRLLKIWATPTSAVSALELLDAKFPDPVVREYAISLLRSLRDDELRNYLLQMVQCLKFEPYHDSPLKRFLIERALANPMNIGHYFFWHLKAEVHAPMCCERFGLILEEYLSFAGRFTLELKKQASAVLKLQRVAEMVVRLKRDHGYGDPEAMKEYSKECEKLNADFFGPMGKFQLPLDPKIEVTSLVVEKCRYMSSKMVPLWLVFKNADPDAPNVYVIFKSGDDLRQDILTLQILSLMDSLWLSAGTDCKMKPYKCIATGVNEHGEGVGLIEVVLNSDTTSGIQLKYGGGAVGALKMDPLDLFLREHNKIAKDYEKAVENFVNSCAGYCVATFVLGIGDRHNGNIMVTKDGHLFHIDFGHFLGNFKSKFGINRERAAFVFTPEMAFVMGGNKYRSSSHFKKFLEYCAKAFLVLRKNANLLENLFGLMVAAGMPELIKESDIYYMRDKLYLNEKESKAEKKLNEEIENSLDSKYRRLDNFIHNYTVKPVLDDRIRPKLHLARRPDEISKQAS